MKKAALFFLLLLAGSSTIAATALARGDARVALLIANSAYPDDATPLAYPGKDAQALALELRRLDFEVETADNLGRQALLSSIEGFTAKIAPGSIAMVFFSGYAVQVNRQNYIIPVNAQIWSEADVRRDGILIESVVDAIHSRGARAKLVVLDASRRNPFERRIRGFAAGLAPMTTPRGTLVISAALPGQLSNDGTGPNSLFVGELLKELRAPNLAIEQIFIQTRIGVSRVTNGEQVPWMSSSLSEDISFRRPPASTPAAPAAAPGPVPAPLVADPNAEKPEDCESAKQDATKKAWSNYLAKYPAGLCVELARDQLAKIDQTPQVKPQIGQPADDREMSDLDNVLQLNPKDSNAFYRRGQAFAKRGNYSRAIDDFGQALTLNPKDAEAWNNRCWTRAVVGQLQAALLDCNMSLSLQPNYADAYDSRGFVMLKMNSNAKAISDFNAALRGNPEQASSLYGRGKARQRNGDTVGGNMDIEAAKAIQRNIAEEFARYGVQ